MLFYINAGIFSPSDEISCDTVATYSTSVMSLRIQVLSVILLCLQPSSVYWLFFFMLEYPWPRDGYDLEDLIQAANLCSGKQQEEMGSTSHVYFFNYEK